MTQCRLRLHNAVERDYFFVYIKKIIIGKLLSDIADGLVGVGLITQSEDNPGFLTLDKGYNDMSKFLNRQVPSLVGTRYLCTYSYLVMVFRTHKTWIQKCTVNRIRIYIFIRIWIRFSKNLKL